MNTKSLMASLVALIVLGGGVAPFAAAADDNVLLVTIDTIRTDRLSCYGSKFVQTPRIDGLAANGALFERAFSHAPLTLPAHTNILLGLTALAHGVNESNKSIVPGEFITLAELLKKSGYATAAFVSAFPLDSRFGLTRGFDVYDDAYPSKPTAEESYSERPAGKTVAAALRWLAGRKGKWFCWVHLWDPHAPYAPPEPYADRFKADPYSGEVAYVDAELGKLLDEIDKGGGLNKTLVVLTGDHGEALGEHGEMGHGYFAYNATIRIPLIIAGPGTKALRVTEMVSHVDIFPTVCEILGLERPPSLHGESLAPFLRGRTVKARPIYFESLEANRNRGWAPLRGIIADGKKFIDSPIPELYDLEKDFAEGTNLAPGTDLQPYRKILEDKMKRDASPLHDEAVRRTDQETRERLRSLGYASSPVGPVRNSYGPADDLKTLLPLEQKVTLALKLENDGRSAESVKLLEDVIAARKDYGRAYDQLFRLYRSRGLIDDGLAVLERAYTANLGNYVIVSGYGVVLVQNSRYAKGIEILEKALGLFDRDAEVWMNLGIAHARQGDFARAAQDFTRALEIDPNDPSINDNAGAFYFTKAVKEKSAEDLRKSREFFEKAVAADPGLASAFNGLGGVLKIMGRTDDAVRNWEKAYELDPKFAFPVYNLALAYLEKGEKARAYEHCQKYLIIRGKDITLEERNEINALIQKCR
jgi:arylsulfatase A-like enzyme/tetratricopeptide (TPR) repeat protein